MLFFIDEFLSVIFLRLLRPHIVIAFRADEATVGSCPLALHVDFQRGIVQKLPGCAPVRILAAGMADEDEQLAPVLFLELDVLGKRHIRILETVYHYEVG